MDSERIGLSTHITFYDKIWMDWILEKSAFSFFPIFIFIFFFDEKVSRKKISFDHSGSIGEKSKRIR